MCARWSSVCRGESHALAAASCLRAWPERKPSSRMQAMRVRAVEDLATLFGKAPRAYAYDRGGYSTENVKRLRKLGVRDIGLAPRGRTPWEVEGKVKDRLIRERAMVEGSIGTIKCPKYGFNRPAAPSAAMMGVCGQRAGAWAQPHQAVSRRCRKKGDGPGGMSETRGPRSAYGRNREAGHARSMGRPDIAICSPSFPTSSS